MVDSQRLAGADRDTACLGVLVYDVERRSICDSDAAALADREAVEPFVLSEDSAVDRDYLTSLRLFLAQAGQEVGLVDPSEEAEVLGLLLVGHWQVGFACSPSHVRLQRVTQGEPQLVEVVRGESGK